MMLYWRFLVGSLRIWFMVRSTVDAETNGSGSAGCAAGDRQNSSNATQRPCSRGRLLTQAFLFIVSMYHSRNFEVTGSISDKGPGW